MFLKAEPMNHQIAQCYENPASFKALLTWLEIYLYFEFPCSDWKFKGLEEHIEVMARTGPVVYSFPVSLSDCLLLISSPKCQFLSKKS